MHLCKSEQLINQFCEFKPFLGITFLQLAIGERSESFILPNH